ncbi:MAG TPA: PASTA domain-containing protein [Gemmatimonadales bacterium]|nr:PASTA domain-containing protein [Gemmatimonadales bacterium]
MQFTRPSGARPAFLRTIAGQRFLRQAAVVLAAFLVGYLITVFWLFPAPLFKRQHATPGLLDMGVTAAREKLEGQGFRFHLDDQETDPTAPKGTVIWQDPPPGVAVEPNAQISLIVSDGPADVPVPDVAAFPRGLAEKVLKTAGFTLGRLDTLPSQNPAGTIVQTRPGPGVARPAGTPIDLVLSSGPAEVSVPGLLGLPVGDARNQIEALGLAVGRITSRFVPGRPEGLVLQQQPSAGTRSPRGARVDLIVTKKAP